MTDPASLAYVFCGGEPPPVALAGEARRADLIIAADSGLDHARSFGCQVDLLVGDLDSVSAGGLSAARALDMDIEEHPVDKDRSDLELALDAAVARGARRIVLAGGSGGRLDYVLGNALLLASPTYGDAELEQWGRDGRIVVVRRPTTLPAAPGDRCTLVALGLPATGVTTTGLRWALDGATLAPGSSWGHSNEVIAPDPTVTLDDGVLLAIIPTVTQD